MRRSLVPFAVLIAFAACDSGSSSGGPIPPPQPPTSPQVLPGPGWPELPPGAGAAEIAMEGVWDITNFAPVVWEPPPWITAPDPLGQTLAVAPHAVTAGFVELADFAWYQPVPGTLANENPWARNEGDGKFLLYSYGSGAMIGGWLTVAIAIGSTGPDTMVGHYVELARTTGFIGSYEVDFTFTAERR